MKKAAIEGFLDAVTEYGRALPEELVPGFMVAVDELKSEIESDRNQYWRGMDRLRTASAELSKYKKSLANEGPSKP